MFASPKTAAPARRIGRGSARMTSRLLGLRRDQSGNVAMLFSLLLIPLVAMVGLAVDFGRVYSVTSHTQAALDAAALAAGRAAQLSPTNTVAAASAAATAYFNQVKPTDVVSSTLQFSPNAANTQFTVTATSWVKTPFLGVLYTFSHKGAPAGAPPGSCQNNGFGCVVINSTSTATLCPSTACSGSGAGGSNVEISLMLDVTGSMCSPCSKIQAVQSAAKDLIDIVVWSDQSQYYSRVALAPFAEAVNAGTTLAPAVRGTVTTTNSSNPQVFTSSDMSNTAKQPTKSVDHSFLRLTAVGRTPGPSRPNV